jgi:hypothetical protein
MNERCFPNADPLIRGDFYTHILSLFISASLKFTIAPFLSSLLKIKDYPSSITKGGQYDHKSAVWDNLFPSNT